MRTAARAVGSAAVRHLEGPPRNPPKRRAFRFFAQPFAIVGSLSAASSSIETASTSSRIQSA